MGWPAGELGCAKKSLPEGGKVLDDHPFRDLPPVIRALIAGIEGDQVTQYLFDLALEEKLPALHPREFLVAHGIDSVVDLVDSLLQILVLGLQSFQIDELATSFFGFTLLGHM